MYTLRIVSATIQVLPKQLLLLALMTVLEGGLGGPITPRPSCNHNFHPRGAEGGQGEVDKEIFEDNVWRLPGNFKRN